MAEFDRVCEVQSDKAAVEITSRYAGTIRRLCHDPGAMVQARQHPSPQPGASPRPPLHTVSCLCSQRRTCPCMQQLYVQACWAQVGEALLEVEVSGEEQAEKAAAEAGAAAAASDAEPAPAALQPVPLDPADSITCSSKPVNELTLVFISGFCHLRSF